MPPSTAHTAAYTPLPSASSSPAGSGTTTPQQPLDYPPSSPVLLASALRRIDPSHSREFEENDVETEVDEEEVTVAGEDRATRFVWTLVSTAAISGLLFGYDTGVISGTLVAISIDLGTRLSDWQKELITSATTLGALIGGLVAGALSDYTGRKPVIALANIVFIAGALCQAACDSVQLMVAGRFVVGIGVGLASCIVPLYIGELSPTKIRGRLVTINAVAVTLGQVLAYGIGATFQYVPSGWRWMVGLGAAPAIIQLLALFALPESPRMLLLRSREPAARKILARVYPLASDVELDTKVRIMSIAVRQSVAVAQSVSWPQRLKSVFSVGMNRRALVIGSGLQAAQQLCGFNTLMYYSASIFASLGFKSATGVGLIIASVNFLFTLVALKVVDPLGRRRTMLYTLPIMVVGLVLSSLFFYKLTRSTGGILVDGAEYSSTYSSLVIFSMVLYVAGFATGLGNIPWQQGELFRLDVRGIGTSICTATNWSCNLLIAATFLTLMRAATPAGAFGIYAGFCALSWMFCYLLYPETSGLSLEEVYFIFEEDFGVEKSQEMRRRKKLSLVHDS